MRNIYASAFAAAALIAGATLATPAAWAQRAVPTARVSVSKQTLKTPKTTVKPQQTARASRPAPQSLRYLISDSP